MNSELIVVLPMAGLACVLACLFALHRSTRLIAAVTAFLPSTLFALAALRFWLPLWFESQRVFDAGTRELAWIYGELAIVPWILGTLIVSWWVRNFPAKARILIAIGLVLATSLPVIAIFDFALRAGHS